MANPQNIKFMSLSDTPIQLESNPSKINLYTVKTFYKNTAWNGIDHFQHISKKIEVELIWDGSVFFDENQYEILFFYFWLADTEFYFYPRPDSAPNLYFKVNWVDEKLNFISMTGQLDGHGYQGTIHLVGAEPLSITDSPAMLYRMKF